LFDLNLELKEILLCRVRTEKRHEEEASRAETERKIKSVLNLRSAIERNKVYFHIFHHLNLINDLILGYIIYPNRPKTSART
jgi:hypothetical protein